MGRTSALEDIMPFGPYDDFDDCVSQNMDKDDPGAYCAAVKRATEGSAVRRASFEPIQYEMPPVPQGVMGPTWEGVLAIEDEMTGDGRMLESGALRWETLPIPLRWVREDVGEHLNAVVVGRIDEVFRDGDKIMGRGVFDAGSADGMEAARHVEMGLTPGVSVDLDDVSFEIRVAADLAVHTEDEDPELDDNGMAVVMRVDPDDEIMVTTDARLRAATIVATPAFAEARLYLRPEDLEFGGHDDEDDDEETMAMREQTYEPVPEDDQFATPEEALERSEQLGCEGTHSHTIDGVTVYMPCGTHEEYDELASAEDDDGETMSMRKHDDDEDNMQGRYDVIESPGGGLPDHYRPATSPDVPEGQACGNCFYFNERDVAPDGRARCMQWGEYVEAGFVCNAWKVRTDDDMGGPYDEDEMGKHDEDEMTASTMQLSSTDRTPSAGMATEAKRALDWRADGNAGGEQNTVERARSIANRQPLGADTIRRMNRFFLRNARYPSLDGFSPGDDGYPSAARVAWGLWGGNAGASWSRALVARMDRMDDNSVITAGATFRPPRSFFEDPELKAATPLTVGEDGRVYGHLATWGTCHTGFSGECVQPPSSASNYAYFRTGAVRVDDGPEVPVGRITLDTTHAGRRLGGSDTAAHYEHTGVAVADVAAGEDVHGIWVAGYLRPGLDDQQIAKLMASPLSGDWRRIGGQLELVAALAVNSPGFPIPRALVSGGAVQSLVASGVLTAPPALKKEWSMDDRIIMARLLERERQQIRAHRREAKAARDRLAFTMAAVRARAAFGKHDEDEMKKHDEDEMKKHDDDEMTQSAWQIRSGTFVEWSFGGGTAQGQVKRVVTDGQIEVDGNVILADPDNPAVLVESWRRVELEAGVFFEPTGQDVARRMDSLTRIEPLRERPDNV